MVTDEIFSSIYMYDSMLHSWTLAFYIYKITLTSANSSYTSSSQNFIHALPSGQKVEKRWLLVEITGLPCESST